MPSTRIKTLSRISSYNVDVINANSVTVLGSSVVGGAGTDAYARTTANTATDNITIIQGVNTTQNTRITSADNTATAAYAKANAAFDQANTDFTTITVTSGVYGNATFVPVITLGANGRVIAVTNTAISSGGGGGATITDDTTSSGTRYITMTTQTSGSQSIANTSTTKLYFQPSTGTLSSTIFSSILRLRFSRRLTRTVSSGLARSARWRPSRTAGSLLLVSRPTRLMASTCRMASILLASR